jgi:hypothetical protein
MVASVKSPELADVALAETIQSPDRNDDLRRHRLLLDPTAARRDAAIARRLIRPGPTRVETYCSNDLLEGARWRDSVAVWVTGQCLRSPCEIPAASLPPSPRRY